MFKKILVPTDGSPISEKSAKAAIEFAVATKASIVALSVAQLYPYMLMPEAGAMLDLSSYEEAQDQTAQSNADKLKTLAESAKVGCETIVKRGVHPYEEIIATANDMQCDVIWIASHGRRGLDKLLLGSETQRVLAHSTLPVMVYR
ncbi:MAG: universal stress protein [Oxalobacteraceae bacterium]|nr:universal stress protein [Oxalobacteraceae bacterium]